SGVASGPGPPQLVDRPSVPHAGSPGPTGVSAPPEPTARWYSCPLSRSTNTNWFTCAPDRTLATSPGLNPSHASSGFDAKSSTSSDVLPEPLGSMSGLPQLHFALGTPCASTSTDVPACNTAR